RQANERIALASEQAARAAAEEASRRSSLLADATRLLFGSLDFWTTVQSLFSVVVPSMADFCSFTLLRDADGFERTDLAWVTETGERVKSWGATVRAPFETSIKPALRSRKPHFFSNDHSPLVEHAPAYPPAAGHDGAPPKGLLQLPPLCAGAAFPVVARGRVL